MMRLISEPGYFGMFTREHAQGAIENGVRIRKLASEPGDAHAAGSLGTILGSVRVGHPRVRYFYFVAWDAEPRAACGVCDFKILQVAS